MKRFLLFAYDHYYPSGGWNDFIDSFDTEEEAEKASVESGRDHYDIVDTLTWVIS